MVIPILVRRHRYAETGPWAPFAEINWYPGIYDLLSYGSICVAIINLCPDFNNLKPIEVMARISNCTRLLWGYAYLPMPWSQWWLIYYLLVKGMMTSSNGNIFRVTDPLWGESTGHRWVLLTKASATELWCFLSSRHEQAVKQTIETPVIWDAYHDVTTTGPGCMWVALRLLLDLVLLIDSGLVCY